MKTHWFVGLFRSAVIFLQCNLQWLLTASFSLTLQPCCNHLSLIHSFRIPLLYFSISFNLKYVGPNWVLRSFHRYMTSFNATIKSGRWVLISVVASIYTVFYWWHTCCSLVTHVYTHSPSCVPSGISVKSTAVTGLFAGGGEESQKMIAWQTNHTELCNNRNRKTWCIYTKLMY